MKSTDQSRERGKLRALENVNNAESLILISHAPDADGVEILTLMRGDHVPAFLGALQTTGVALVKEMISQFDDDDGIEDLTASLHADDTDFDVPDTIPADWAPAPSKAGMLACGCLIHDDGTISKCQQHWADEKDA